NGPLAGSAIYAEQWHGTDGLGGARLPESERTALPDATAFLVERLTAEPGEITVVCTGPCTTLALAVQRQPEIGHAARRRVLMGGTAQLPGNVSPVAEYNIYADPEAAAIVFDQTWLLTMVGLDVTHRVMLSRANVQRLPEPGPPEAVLLREVTRSLFVERGIEAMALHDPLAV